ncbi:hypothetical protein [Actinacidiphila oryziradicis]|uniref:3-keto-disaccharide hydrolase domain-containing protein n=1 Tax=Actinacidiphila oryziradicis TaxID=2571141 RepID=A0A4U0SPF5_9ACTN|nr:hypothetical protein [Actinacidiphila oryziradicis]TKA11924.1 hypothetical protein FCI23_08870 [Actinacidiphila oryziradicis]
MSGAELPRPSRRTLIGGLTLGTAAATAAAYGAAELVGPHEAGNPFTARFPQDGLVTNEYAYRNPHDRRARTSAEWVVTSGSLFAHSGDGWTGLPEVGETGPDSSRFTDSAVFRLVTRRRDFGSVIVRTAVRLAPPITTAQTPAQDWDGGHLWLRYHSPQELYALSFRRRDGLIVVKRKIPAKDASAANGGDYATLAEARHALPYGSWHQLAASAVNSRSGTVHLRLDIDGRTVLTAEDRTPGRLLTPGGVGLRVDNTELYFRDFAAAPHG